LGHTGFGYFATQKKETIGVICCCSHPALQYKSYFILWLIVPIILPQNAIKQVYIQRLGNSCRCYLNEVTLECIWIRSIFHRILKIS